MEKKKLKIVVANHSEIAIKNSLFSLYGQAIAFELSLSLTCFVSDNINCQYRLSCIIKHLILVVSNLYIVSYFLSLSF